MKMGDYPSLKLDTQIKVKWTRYSVGETEHTFYIKMTEKNIFVV